MVFSMSVVKKIIESCTCPTPDSPDDMIIGACLATLNIEITHSPAFHQVISTNIGFIQKLKEIDSEKV